MTCTYIKDPENHKKEATAANTMGGSTQNLHLRPLKGQRNDTMTEIVPLNNDKKETKSLFKTALATILEDVQLDISSQTKVVKRIAAMKPK